MQQRNFFLTLLMAIVMMVLSPQIMRAAVETVTVGEGTSSSNDIPYGNLYKNSTSQMLYAADEIGKKSIIQRYADGEWIIPTGACPHQLIEHAAVTNTCGDDGNTLYYECSICHHYFSDDAAENEMEENSWVIPADPSQHEFTGNYDNNGFGQCAVCNKALYNIYMPAEYDDEENCFHIYNVGQLYWFADKVNNGTPSDEGYPFNAEVYGDLVVNSNVLTDEGELNGDGSNFLAWTPIDNYQGVFNGAGHTIKGLYGGVGLFNNNNGTVTNVGIEDSYFEGGITVGGIVAYNAGTVENSLSLATVKGNSNVGGLVGFNASNGVIKNCYSRATVKAETTDSERYGKVVGYNEGTLANCYYLSNVADQQETEHPTVISKTAEQFASGEVAWLLNGEKVDETSVWGQFLGNDYAPAEVFPRPSMWHFVWKGYMCFDDSLQYANHHLHAEPNHDHVYGNGICEVCGAYQTPESQTTGGVLTFDIANYGNALYVAKYTNEGYTCAARLVVPKVMMTGSDAYMKISNGTLTLDLNGDTLTTNNSQVILVDGGNVTIHDSSTNGTGAVINGSSHGVNAQSGSLTITGGTFIGSGFAVLTSSSCTSLAISGGKYYATSGPSRLYTPGKSALAPDYSYYNLRTGEELKDYTNMPIFAELSTDTVIVKQASVKAVLTKNGEDTNYYSFNTAFTAAQQCTADDNAMLKLMKNYTIPNGYNAYITLSSGTFTLDLNGDTISNTNQTTILVSGANLTITDSSKGQNGALINSGSFAVNITGGSLTVLAGNLIARNTAPALYVGSSSPTVSLKGGKYMSNSTYGSRIYTYGKSLLAPGYSYYNLSTDEEMNDVTSGYISMSNTADTLIVKQGSVKAILTKGDEVTTYKDFNSAFAAAQQCTASDNATLKLMKNCTMPSSEGYITLSSGTFTLDLNGDTISNTNQTTILVSGANLTITDSSKGQNGALINSGSFAVNITGGSLTVLAGNLIARNTAPALYVGSSSPTVSLKGGKYMSNDTYGYRVYTYGKTLLAPGYSYYNLRTDEEMTDITNGSLAMSNIADTLVVKLGSDKMALTKGDNITIYKDINAAFAAAQQCTADDNATLKLLKNVTLPTGNGYITLTDGAFTLDLNGDTLGIKGDWVLKLNGTDLTVTDSSEDKKGALVNTASIVVYAVSGSLTMQSGNLKGKGDYSIYNNEEGMEITLLSGSYSGGMQYHANSTLNLPNVAMFDTEGNEIALKYTEYVDFNCYRTEEPFTVNPYYTVGDVKGKLTKVDNKYFADKLTLVDGMPFNSEYDFTAAEAEYSRTMTTKWGTICLPFDVTVSSVTDKTEEGYQPFDFYYVDDINDDVMTLNKETQKVSAGIGMILRHDGTGGEVSIKETNVEVSSNAACASNATNLWGTFTGKTINSGYYIASDKFWNAANLDEGAVVPPYRAYVAGSGWAAAKGISIFDPEEETTGVTTVTADKADADAWYTLDGVKLSAKPNKAGIYIHGGKKVAVK